MENLERNYDHLLNISQYHKKRLSFIDLEISYNQYENDFFKNSLFSIIQISIIHIDFYNENKIIEKHSYVNPGFNIPEYIENKTNIKNEILKKYYSFDKFIPYLKNIQNDIIFGYNLLYFDLPAIYTMLKKYNTYIQFQNTIDIKHLFTKNRNSIFPIGNNKNSLEEALHFFEIPYENNLLHNAHYDNILSMNLTNRIIEFFQLEPQFIKLKK